MAISIAVRMSTTANILSPLAVLFDAKATTADGVSDPFIDLDYRWEFGDPASGTWDNGSGDSKDVEYGPVATHVYECDPDIAVSFFPSLTVTNPANGDTATWNGQINVRGRNREFPGIQTVCISTDTDFTGAPAGATLITTTDLAEINTQIAAGRRCILLRAGKTWTYAGDIDLDEFGRGVIGSFGSGAKPKITTSGQTRLFQVRNLDCREWRIMDLDVVESGTATTMIDATGATGAVEDLTVLRCDFEGGLRLIYLNPNLISAPDIYKRICVADCIAKNQDGNVHFMGGEDLSLLGCHFYHDGGGGAHLIRTQMADVGIFAHCLLDNPDLDRHHHKFHGGEFDTDGNNADSLDNRHSQYWVVRRNTYILGGEASWMFMASPQNNSADERLRLGIVEANYFILDQASAGTKIPITVEGDRIVVRNNLIQADAGTTTHIFVSVGRDDGTAAEHPGSDDVRIFNNTGYRDSDGATTFVETQTTANATKVYNNFGSAPNATPAEVLLDDNGTSTTSGNNAFDDTPGFATEPPVAEDDFDLLVSSDAVDSGSSHQAGMLGRDYLARVAPSNAYDKGAYEFQHPSAKSSGPAVESLGRVAASQAVAVESREETSTSGLKFKIEGVDRSGLYQARSLRIRERINSSNSLDLVLVDDTQTFHPKVGHDIVVRYNGALIFSGWITRRRERTRSDAPVNFIQLSCVDWNKLAERFTVLKNYEVADQTLGDIATDLINVAADGGLAQEGVTIGTIDTGPAIEKAIFPYKRHADCFDELAKVSGLVWNIDYEKEFSFTSPLTNPAPFQVGYSPTLNYREITVDESQRKYRNEQYLRAGTQRTKPQSQVFVGDGEEQTFNTRFRIDNDPDLQKPTVEVNISGGGYVEKTVGVRGVDDDEAYEWFYERGSDSIAQRDSDTALTSNDNLRVSYVGQFPLRVRERDEDEIARRAAIEGGTGVYSDVENDDEVDTRQLALDKADGLLRRYGFIPTIVKVTTDKVGLRCGQLLDIKSDAHGIENDFLISELEIRDVSTGNEYLRWEATCERDEAFESWTEFFNELFKIKRRFTIAENDALVLVVKKKEAVQLEDTLVQTNLGAVASGELYSYLADPYTIARIGYVPTFGPHTSGFDMIPSARMGFARIGPHPAQDIPSPAMNGFIDVTDHGAVGDGTTDDTTAIQNAIDAATTLLDGTGPARTVLFPDGNYKITARVDVPPNIILRGVARLSTNITGSHILVSHNGVGIRFVRDNSPATGNLFHMGGMVDLGISGIGSSGGSQKLIELGDSANVDTSHGAWNCFFDRCFINNTYGHGVYCTHTQETVFRNCFFKDTKYAIEFPTVVASSKILDCSFHDPGEISGAIAIQGRPGSLGGSVGFMVAGSYFLGWRNAIWLTSISGAYIHGNEFEGTVEDCIRLDRYIRDDSTQDGDGCVGFSIVGNSWINWSSNGGGHAAIQLNYSKDGYVGVNSFHSPASGAGPAVDYYDNSEVETRDNVIEVPIIINPGSVLAIPANNVIAGQNYLRLPSSWAQRRVLSSLSTSGWGAGDKGREWYIDQATGDGEIHLWDGSKDAVIARTGTLVVGGDGFLTLLKEISDPSAPGAGECVLYLKDVGGKTQLTARFETGAVQQVAIEP